MEMMMRKREEVAATLELEVRTGSPVLHQFGTPIYRDQLRSDVAELKALNEELLEDVKQIWHMDKEGREWSDEHYQGGYTSYKSVPKLTEVLDSARRLEEWLEPHVRAFQEQAGLQDLPELKMTECWVNIMGEGTEHAFHQHRFSTVSGTYYVATPEGCSGISFEDPRVDRISAFKQRKVVEYPVHAGEVVLFESWMRHKVAANCAGSERISISFNYHGEDVAG
mmetsp:Transcript_166657/g.529631  ORF Transcript_166657/g.529631 Transcript_166657/m.529631 type:complete len:224 (+) Transcript_166657:315-986(+)